MSRETLWYSPHPHLTTGGLVPNPHTMDGLAVGTLEVVTGMFDQLAGTCSVEHMMAKGKLHCVA